MATLEDAAEELVVKLRGLDSEIEESSHKLEELRDRVEDVGEDVEKEWTALGEAVTSFLDKVREEQEALDRQAQETLQGVSDAHQAVAEDGAAARTEIAEGHAQLEALGQHATGLEPGVESLTADAGEAPARSLAERAHELQQELERVVEEARDFLRDEVVPAVEHVATDVRERCQELHRELAEEMTGALQQAFDDWEPKVDQLEEYVATKGFQTSQHHAHDVVDYALEECQTACGHQLEDLQQLVGILVTQLGELATEVHHSADTLVTQAGTELAQELDRTRDAGVNAVAALDAVRQRLAAYSFVEV